MLVTQTWQFPPFPTLITRSYLDNKVDMERHRIAEAENCLRNLPANPNIAHAHVTDLSHGYVMIFDHNQVLRQPPTGMIDELKQLDHEYKLGTLLRCCPDPNLLNQIMTQQQPKQSLRWLVPMLVRDAEALQSLSWRARTQIIVQVLGMCPFTNPLSLYDGTSGSGSSGGHDHDLHQAIIARLPSLFEHFRFLLPDSC
jgi:hypothetical protein